MEKKFRQIEDILNTTVNDLLNFTISDKNYKEEIVKLEKNFNIESNINFNIFTAFSDYYYKENLHSDILKYIFDPHTEKIRNKKYIEIFKGFIAKNIGRSIELDLNSVKIERETNRIDLLIYDNLKNCIFIENKINNALDRKNQIGKYYSRLIEKRYKVRAIVYLTLSPLKKLDREYSIEDTEDREKIEKILIELPVINKINENSFVDDILNKCIDVSNNMVSTVFLTEYSSLLKYLGGTFMAKELNTRAMYKIFENKETLNSFRIFGNLWDNRDKIIGKTFKDYFQNELGFSIHSGDADSAVFKTIKENINIGFHVDFSFGFIHTPETKQITPENRKLFKGVMENEKFKKYFTEDKVYSDGWWVCKKIDYEKISCLNDLKILLDELKNIIEEKL
jgi:hypothetical protein